MEKSEVIIKKELNYDELKNECKKLGLTNSALYRKFYRKYGLPAHPERIFPEWVSYRDFFDIPDFISYQSLKQLIAPFQLKNATAYKAFVEKTNDPSIPFDPQTAYSDEWENWYAFLGKEEPFKPNFIPTEYSMWADSIDKFMLKAKGGGTKISHLCRFVRLFIMPFDKSKSPYEFLTQKRFDIKPFRDLAETLSTPHMKRKFLVSVNEFLDHIINTDLTEEDEETGIVARIANARNPFSLLLTQEEPVSANARSETTKPCLQYHFVKKFDADWIKVDPSLIDKKDPDCIYKVSDGQTFLWLPMDWLHTYALTKVPLRGRQIAYNDSGEADEYIADIDSHGKIIWVKNKSLWSFLQKEIYF